MKGYLQVYTGNGKGKTTAAIGLAIRAAGAGLAVLFAQFVKGRKYNEIRGLERYNDLITVKQFGRGCFIKDKPTTEDIESARNGLAEIEIDLKGNYRLVILDEANIAVHFGLFTANELLRVVECRQPDCEVVITGRYAAQSILDAADLVTEMKEVKHYFAKGVPSRDGIEQ